MGCISGPTGRRRRACVPFRTLVRYCKHCDELLNNLGSGWVEYGEEVFCSQQCAEQGAAPGPRLSDLYQSLNTLGWEGVFSILKGRDNHEPGGVWHLVEVGYKMIVVEWTNGNGLILADSKLWLPHCIVYFWPHDGDLDRDHPEEGDIVGVPFRTIAGNLRPKDIARALRYLFHPQDPAALLYGKPVQVPTLPWPS